MKKTLLAALLAVSAAGVHAEEIGASVSEVERWSSETHSAVYELTLTNGEALGHRALFIKSSDATIDLFDLTMTRILRIKPRQSIDMSTIVEGRSSIAVSIDGGMLVYVEVSPGMSLKASAAKEDLS